MWTGKMISVAIVDDHHIVIEGLKTLLKDEENIRVVDSFITAASFVSFIQKNAVDVVLLDISLPDESGIELCKKIKLISPETRILALSNLSERSIILRMIQNGANGYLLKNVSSRELTSSIYKLMNGEIVFSEQIKQIITNPVQDEFKEIPRLTRRELEILKLIAKGQTTQEIADQLFVSPLTIETHRRNLMAKFQVKNAAELIMAAARDKFI